MRSFNFPVIPCLLDCSIVFGEGGTRWFYIDFRAQREREGKERVGENRYLRWMCWMVMGIRFQIDIFVIFPISKEYFKNIFS